MNAADRPPMADLAPLRRAIALAVEAADVGDLPFGAVLTASDGRALLERRNSVVTDRDCTAHAETALVREASRIFDAATLAGSTLYASCEPCAMCAGAIYRAGIGRVVYAMSGAAVHALLRERYGDEVLELPSRSVFASGSRSVQVDGPYLAAEVLAPHDRYRDRRNGASPS